MTLSSPPGEANNGVGGPSVEAASLPGAFSTGNGQASRADRGDEFPVTPQVSAGPSSYDNEEEPLPDLASGDDSYGDTYDNGYDAYVPPSGVTPSGDVVGESIPVVPLTTGTQSPKPDDITTQPTTPSTQPTTPAPTSPITVDRTTPNTTPSTTPASPSPSPAGTALPFEPEDDIVVDVPIFSLTPTGTSSP